ncbi:MAG: hypothetical protein AAFQ80_19785 [Cyanobacteria bacterium J06621_8]
MPPKSPDFGGLFLLMYLVMAKIIITLIYSSYFPHDWGLGGRKPSKISREGREREENEQ